MKAKKVHKILEGVGDEYAYFKWGIPREDPEFERRYKEFRFKKYGNVVGEVKGYPLVKNPQTLNLFPPAARGITLKNGDLYMSPDVENTIHVDILEELNNLKITSEDLFAWEDPEYHPPNQFIAVQRVWTTDYIGLSESYTIPKKKHPEKREKVMKLFEPFIEAANRKSPQFNFVNDFVFSIAKNILPPNQYKKHCRMSWLGESSDDMRSILRPKSEDEVIRSFEKLPLTLKIDKIYDPDFFIHEKHWPLIQQIKLRLKTNSDFDSKFRLTSTETEHASYRSSVYFKIYPREGNLPPATVFQEENEPLNLRVYQHGKGDVIEDYQGFIKWFNDNYLYDLGMDPINEKMMP